MRASNSLWADLNGDVADGLAKVDLLSANTEICPQDNSYQRALAETLLADRDPARILAFKNKVS